MTDNKSNIELVLEALQESLPEAGIVYGKKIDNTLLETYAQYLADCNPFFIKEAINNHVVNHVYGSRFPLPCDITREIKNATFYL